MVAAHIPRDMPDPRQVHPAKHPETTLNVLIRHRCVVLAHDIPLSIATYITRFYVTTTSFIVISTYPHGVR